MQSLTKTTYLAFTRCPKQFWLDAYQPDLAAPPDPAAQRRLHAGQQVDKLAREQFPHGRLIPYRPHPEEMASLTAQALFEGATTLFQATFTVADLLVKVDILRQTEAGWHLLEVKSSTSYKAEEHLPDIAFQVYVLRQSGLAVTQAGLMHLNRECRHPDLTNLFTITDVTRDVDDFLPQVRTDVERMRLLVASANAPAVGIGRHCAKPYTCTYYLHCWQAVDGLTIYEIPYLKPTKEQELEADGVHYVADIPPEFALGDKRATAFVKQTNQRQIVINREAIQAELADLVYPLYFFDFETIDYAVPIFAGCTPYHHTPFQYSCHILDVDGTLAHRHYLHTATDDPRRPLIQALLQDIESAGSIIAYYVPFEKKRLQELATAFPEYAPQLLDMVERLWDQWNIFKRHYRDYRFGGSNSLKAVLPVVVPALSYQMLAVQNGAQAQVVWEEMIQCEDTAVKTQLADQLYAYCHLDTLAMVEIHQAISAL